MLEVICALHTFYQHIIHVHLHDVPNEILDLIYHPLKGGPYVLEAVGHHFVAVNSPTSGESCFIFIWRVHFDLIILGIGVHEAKEFMAGHGFYYLIDPWEGI